MPATSRSPHTLPALKKSALCRPFAVCVCGCTDSGIDETPYGGSDNTENPGDGNDSEDEKPDIPEYSINGSVQKGSSSKALSSLSRS